MSKLIIANWKSNHTLKSAHEWLNQVEKIFEQESSELKVILAPPFPLISGIAERIRAGTIELAVQDISPYGAGSYTGAVSTANLIGLPVEYVLIGHSERRRFFGEIDEMEADKVRVCLKADITPVLCLDKPYIKSQAEALKQAEVELPENKLIIVYEPLQAIGSGKNEDPAKVKSVVQEIKNLYGGVQILYGGSVNADNAADYLEFTDGVLVGTASLGADSFISLIKASG